MRKLAAFLALSGTACSTFRVQRAPTASVVSGTTPRRVRVTLRNGDRIELFDATIAGDSVVGYSAARGHVRRERRAVATTDVASVAVPQFSTVKTLFALTTIAVAVAIVSAGSGSSSSSQNTGSCESTAAPVSPA